MIFPDFTLLSHTNNEKICHNFFLKTQYWNYFTKLFYKNFVYEHNQGKHSKN